MITFITILFLGTVVILGLIIIRQTFDTEFNSSINNLKEELQHKKIALRTQTFNSSSPEDYLKHLSAFISEAKSSVYVYNFFIDKKNIKNTINKKTNDFHRKYYTILEKAIRKTNVVYKRIFQASYLSEIESRTEYELQIIENLYKENLLHIKRVFDFKQSFLYIKYKSGWRYNFMIIDERYLIIEHYKHTNSGNRLIPDHCVIYDVENRDQANLVRTYLEYFHESENNKSFSKKTFLDLIDCFDKIHINKIKSIKEKLVDLEKEIEIKKSILNNLDSNLKSKIQELNIIEKEIQTARLEITVLKNNLEIESERRNSILDVFPN